MTDVGQIRRQLHPFALVQLRRASVCEVGSCEGRLRRQLHKVLQHRARSRASDQPQAWGEVLSQPRSAKSTGAWHGSYSSWGAVVLGMHAALFLEAEAV